MELLEREEFMALLHKHFQNIAATEGHCVLVSGEAGIGKTSLVKQFCKNLSTQVAVYTGTCDALFAPRPLAPLYDVLLQLNHDWPARQPGTEDRTVLFSQVFKEIKTQTFPCILIFEDIHWADEATLDFIKFLARRITQLPCLFILTYRDNEIHPRHPLRNVLGQLIPGSFTKMELPLLSKEAVEKLAAEKGHTEKDIYSISGGNPFYVNELLASYNLEIPDSIRDSILYAYNNCNEKSKLIWDILAVMPAAFEIDYLEKLAPAYEDELAICLHSKTLVVENNCISFKHELFRKTVESVLSPFEKIKLHKKILELFLQSFEARNEVERIVHHAKNANEYELIVRYAPLAARQAASVGAHIEAARLYLTTIEYYQGNDKDVLIHYYEAYAYECYLTNQIKEAIIYTGKAFNLWKEKNDTEKTGNSLRFLSRLWWFDGNRKNAERFGQQAIEVLDSLPASSTKAMAFSNMSQLKMLSHQPAECIFWGEKAIAMAKELGSDEILSHALNNVGAVQMVIPSSEQKGMELLQQSLDIAIKNAFHEHVARAYTNLGSNAVKLKNYEYAKRILNEGIQYCEERDLDSWTAYMLSWVARMKLEIADWTAAYSVADNLLKNENQPVVVKITALIVVALIQTRRGEASAALPLLLEAKTKAFETMELQRVIPSLVALLEYEWLTGETIIEKENLESTAGMMQQAGTHIENSEFVFWVRKARGQHFPMKEISDAYDVSSKAKALRAAAFWEQSGCPYQQALSLFEAGDDGKRKAITIVHALGAMAAYEKMKQEMRNSGIKNIPRGIRKSTRANTAFLTCREVDVLELMKEGLQNKEIAAKLFVSPKTVDHHVSSILFKLDVNSRAKAVQEALRLEVIK